MRPYKKSETGYKKTINYDVSYLQNINEQNKIRTALHTAVKKENLVIIQFLLNHKNIDVDAKDEQGKTPLEYSTNQQILELFKNK